MGPRSLGYFANSPGTFTYDRNQNSYADGSSIPRRGEKDFEPNPTEHQTGVLSESRRAMHNALSFPRLHSGKTHVVAFYAPDGYFPLADIPQPKAGTETEKSSESAEKPARPAPKSANISPDACVYVPNPKGQLFKSLGQADRWNRLWLLPEEALYLLERGSLDIRWPSSSSSGAPGEDELSIPMSLQAAYASFVGHGGLTLERYSVYTGLKRLGYTLARTSGWNDEVEPKDSDTLETSKPVTPDLRGAGLAGIFASIFNWIHDPHSTASTATGPIIGTGIHRHYSKSHGCLLAMLFLSLTNLSI
jgi:tRNA-splicing endonuclease subunit Sen54